MDNELLESLMEDLQFVNIMCTDILEEGIIFSTRAGREKVKNNINLINKALDVNLKAIELFIPLCNKYLNDIDKPLTEKDKMNGSKMWNIAKKFHDESIDLDYGRGSEPELIEMSKSYIKYHFNKFFNRADLRHSDVSNEYNELMDKISEHGNYQKRIAKINNELENIRDRIIKMQTKYKNNSVNLWFISVAIEEWNYNNTQSFLTLGDMEKIK